MPLIASWTDTKIPATGTTSQIFTVPVAVPAGTTLFAAVSLAATAASVAVVDSKSNTWIVPTSLTMTNLGCGALLRCHVTTALAAGDTITITLPVTTNRWAVVFGAFDDVIIPANSAVAPGVSGALTTIAVGPTPADIQPSSLIVMSACTTSGGYPYVAQSGLTTVGTVVSAAASVNRGAGLFYRYATAPKPNPDPFLTPVSTPIAKKIIGATSEFGMWPDVLAGAGPEGIKARRHYPYFVATGKNKSADIENSVANGRIPVISYKPPTLAEATEPDKAGMLAGTYDAMIAATRDYLVSLNVPVIVSFWHEPYNELTPAEYITCCTKFLDIFGDQPNISHGPILNGWLLDSDARTTEFKAFIPPALVERWDFVALDTYQDGTNAAPGLKVPGRAIPILVNILTEMGYPNKPVGVGEYNGLTADMIAQAGEIFLSTPTLWFALLWVGIANSNGVDWTMDEAKWAAYKATKADTRAYGLLDPVQYNGSVQLAASANSIGLLEVVESGSQPTQALPVKIWNGTTEVAVKSVGIWNGSAEVPIASISKS